MYHADYVAAVLVAIICGMLAIFVTILAIYLLFQYAPTERQKRARGFSDWIWIQWKRELLEEEQRKEAEARAREEEASGSASASVDEEWRSSGGSGWQVGANRARQLARRLYP